MQNKAKKMMAHASIKPACAIIFTLFLLAVMPSNIRAMHNGEDRTPTEQFQRATALLASSSNVVCRHIAHEQTASFSSGAPQSLGRAKNQAYLARFNAALRHIEPDLEPAEQANHDAMMIVTESTICYAHRLLLYYMDRAALYTQLAAHDATRASSASLRGYLPTYTCKQQLEEDAAPAHALSRESLDAVDILVQDTYEASRRMAELAEEMQALP